MRVHFNEKLTPSPASTRLHQFAMRPTRALGGVILLLVVLLNLYLLFRSYSPVSVVPESTHTEGASAKPDKFHKNEWGSDTASSRDDTKDKPKGSSKDDSRENPKAEFIGDASNHNAADEFIGPSHSDTTGSRAHDSTSHDSTSHDSTSHDSAAHDTKDSTSKGSSSPKQSGDSNANYLYNHNEFAPQYKEGVQKIKVLLDEMADVHPGAGPFDPEKDYHRQIQIDTQLREQGELPATSLILGMYLQLKDKDVAALQKSHRRIMDLLPEKVPENAFGGRGVVMTGGGKYFPMVLTAIKWLRDVDAHVPIEVFMADNSEYEKEFCDDLFPKLNVQCRVIRDIYGAQLSAKLGSQYALKPLAILASKFDDIFFMDADSYPLESVNHIFDWSVYKDTGYILNSDYWPRYISPRFYEIVGRKLGGRVTGDKDDHALLQSDRENAIPGPSTESGQIYIRKSQHIRSLMLAMYYNLYGPDVYFPLLMQNGHGEGDKDTYVAAAVICNESYYQTNRRPVTLGPHKEDGSYQGFAMGQPDAITDYARFELGDLTVKEKFTQLHANSIKSNIKYLMMPKSDVIRGAPQLRQHRYLGNMENIKKEMLTDEDLELRLFGAMRDVACDWVLEQGYTPVDWKSEDPKRFCRVLKAHTKWLAQNPNVEAPDYSLHWFDLDRDGKIPNN